MIASVNQLKIHLAKDFNSATNIRWQKEKNLDKATFNFNNQVMFAYYDLNGCLIVASRNIVSENLPIKLQAALKNSYSNYWISDLFENAAHDETTYYVTLENADQKIILKSNDSNEWSVYQRVNKNVE